jgi:hypothetical protein
MREETASRLPILGLWLSIYMIGLFLWRFFTPAHEYDVRSVQMLDMTLDALATVALIAIFARSIGAGADNSRLLRVILIWAALASAAGIWLIRFSSDEGWWTGHRLYSLLPR